MTIPAYPLLWPEGWRRTDVYDRTTARFSKKKAQTSSWRDGQGQLRSQTYNRSAELTIAEAVTRVRDELQRMRIGDDDLVISTNLALRLDGFPKSAQREPTDPGVAVYWTDKTAPGAPPRCMAIDRYDRVADNLAAVAATLDSMRSIERHGGAEILNRAFTGFVALEGPAVVDWRTVLGTLNPEGNARQLLGKYHPDRNASPDAPALFQRVKEALDAWRREQTG